MKLKIVSDGTSMGTRLVTAEGETIEGVARINYDANAERHMNIADIKLIGVPVELDVEACATTCECERVRSEIVCKDRVMRGIEKVYGPQPVTINPQRSQTTHAR